WFTATESAAVAVLYAAVLSFFFYREMDGPKLWQALLETGKLSAIALFCVGTASVFGWLLAYYQIPKALLQNVTSWGLGPIGVGFFIVFVFLVVGCFLDAIPAIIIVGTTLQPLADSVGMHPVSFAIISIVALAFGLVTPPYGLCLMISCAIAKVRLRYALKDTMIMLAPMLVVLAALIIWPDIPLVLPDQRLTPQQYLAFARRFGPPEPHVIDQFHHPEESNILILSNRKTNGQPIGLADAGTYFHTDYSYLQVPARATMLYSIEVPKAGGHTLFANQYVAYDELSDAMKRRIAPMIAVHHYGNRKV